MPTIDTPNPVDDAQAITDTSVDTRQATGTILPALTTLAASAALSACGGGGDSAEPIGSQRALPAGTTTLGTPADPATLSAFRLLTQGTFGPVPAEVTTLAASIRSLGVLPATTAWVDNQLGRKNSVNHFTNTQANYYTNIQFYYSATEGAKRSSVTVPQEDWYLRTHHLTAAWWKNALTAPDQLRLRVAFALSEILTISMAGSLANFPYMCASYYDMLVDNAFGSYKDLVTKVAGHPAMGMYLSHLGNQRPDLSIGRIPDQNFAREIMQLFTIGLYKLNMDGSQQLATNGKPIETYTPDDVKTLSNVFTGWSWAGTQFVLGLDGPLVRIDAQTSQMSPYPAEHSLKIDFPGGSADNIKLLSTKLTITEGAPAANRKAALDIIFAHQNVAPFIAKQMIQRLVTSNPSKAYVGTVAKAFKDSNFNLGTLVKAILTHADAYQADVVRKDTSYGKLKEPVLRLSQFLRAMSFQSVNNVYVINSDTDPDKPGLWQSRLGQGPLESPSVFNFFRPGYVAPGTKMGKQGKFTPEMQISGESEIAMYAQVMQRAAYGHYGTTVNDEGKPRHAGAKYSVFSNFTDELTLLTNAAQAGNWLAGADSVIASINQKLFGGTMSQKLIAQLQTVTQNSYTGGQAGLPQFHKLALATMLFMAALSPEYVVQR